MTLIPAEHIPIRDGAPERMEVFTIGDIDVMPLRLAAFSVAMTPEEVASAKADLVAKIEAVSTLTGTEIPPELTERLEALAEDTDTHRAVIGEPFELCWN